MHYTRYRRDEARRRRVALAAIDSIDSCFRAKQNRSYGSFRRAILVGTDIDRLNVWAGSVCYHRSARQVASRFRHHAIVLPLAQPCFRQGFPTGSTVENCSVQGRCTISMIEFSIAGTCNAIPFSCCKRSINPLLNILDTHRRGQIVFDKTAWVGVR